MIGTGATLRPLVVVVTPHLALAALMQAVPVLAPAFTAAKGLPPEAVGLISGLVGLGSLWFYAASGALMPALGAVRALRLACLGGALAVAAMAAGPVWLIGLGAPLLGICYAVTTPAGSEILARHTPQRLWGALFSLRMASVPAGGALAGVLGGTLASLWDWRAGIAALILPALLAAGCLHRAARGLGEPPPRRRLSAAAVLAPANLLTPFRSLGANPGLGRLALASLGLAAVQTSTFTFLTTWLNAGAGIGLALAGSLFATCQLASVAGRILAGALTTRLPLRPVLIGLALLSGASALMLAGLRPGLPGWLLTAGAVLIGASVASWNGLFLAEVARAARDPEVATATAAATFFTFLGFALAPPAFAAVSALWGFPFAYRCAAAGALAATLVLALPPRRG